MITPIIIITSALLIWNPGSRKDLNEPDNLNISDRKVKTEVSGNVTQQPDGQTLKDPGVQIVNVQKPVKSEDADTVFKGEILELSKEELTRLGFLFDDEGFYYLNRMPDGRLIGLWSWKSGDNHSSGFEAGLKVNPFNRQKINTFDFYPILSTDLAGNNFHGINLERTFTVDSFNIMNDTLVPILFRAGTYGGTFKNDMILWFRPSDAMLNLIGEDRGTPIGKRIKIVRQLDSGSKTKTDRVYYDFVKNPVTGPGPSDSVKTLKLSAEVFRCLGMNVSDESIYVTFIRDGIPYKWFVNKRGVGIGRMRPDSTGRVDVSNPDTSELPKPQIYAVGTQVFSRVTGDPVGFSVVNSDLLIPIQIADSYLDPFIRKMIFWIYPNERFFRCLPPDIGIPMEKEFNYQRKRLDPNFVPRMGGSIGLNGGGLRKDSLKTGGSLGVGVKIGKDSVNENVEPVPCVYFTHLCESLTGVDFVNLYPNPAGEKLSIDLVLQKAKKIRFRVFDLGGRMISEEDAPVEFGSGGQFTHQMDVSKLQAGFYLLVMTDEEGSRLTRRFVKN